VCPAHALPPTGGPSSLGARQPSDTQRHSTGARSQAALAELSLRGHPGTPDGTAAAGAVARRLLSPTGSASRGGAAGSAGGNTPGLGFLDRRSYSMSDIPGPSDEGHTLPLPHGDSATGPSGMGRVVLGPLFSGDMGGTGELAVHNGLSESVRARHGTLGGRARGSEGGNGGGAGPSGGRSAGLMGSLQTSLRKMSATVAPVLSSPFRRTRPTQEDGERPGGMPEGGEGGGQGGPAGAGGLRDSGRSASAPLTGIIPGAASTAAGAGPTGLPPALVAAGASGTYKPAAAGSSGGAGGANAGGGGDDVDDDTCPVCLDEEPNIRLHRCGHTLCTACAKDLCKRHKLTPALCPYCRAIIAGFKAVSKA
jgi:hypothetical protein